MDKNLKPDQEVLELLTALGRAYLENNENQRAVEKFRQLVHLGIESADIFRNLALALARLESTDEEALEIYKRAVAIEENDEALYLTLATLFLKRNLTDSPALQVFRKALKFSPPFAEEIRGALGNVFRESVESLSLTEIRQFLLDSVDNPDMLHLFLTTAYGEQKYDDTLDVLKDLYSKSNQNEIYLKSLCETLLEKKVHYEENSKIFKLSGADAKFCLKYRDIRRRITRIKEIEHYLDFKNLFLAIPKIAATHDEFEALLSDQSPENMNELVDSAYSSLSIENEYFLDRDFIEKFERGVVKLNSHLLAQLNTVAIFEIKNFDSNPDESKLPFQTFLKLISNKIGNDSETIMCLADDGLVALCSNPTNILRAALETLKKVGRYNLVVEDSETIDLKITVHCCATPFRELPNQGIQEIRKGFKTHTLTIKESENAEESNDFSQKYPVRITESISEFLKKSSLKNLGEFRLHHFPGVHTVFEILFQDLPKEEAEPKTSEVTPVPAHPQTLSPTPTEAQTEIPAETLDDSSMETPIESLPENSAEAINETSNQTLTETPTRKVERDLFGKYELLDSLKENNICSTFQGYDPRLERQVIIKVYKTQAFAGKGFELLRKQFYDEIRKHNRINHPDLGVIYDAGETGDMLYLVREFVDGQSLNEYLSSNGHPASLDKTLNAYSKISQVLAKYHQSQIWHKNLKPDNVYVTKQGAIKLLDGGILQIKVKDRAFEDIDSKIYAAPEQLKGIKITRSCDNFQLGVMLYETLTGAHPFMAKSAEDVRVKILAEDPSPISYLRPDLPEGLNQILFKSLAKSPEKRYQSMDEFSLVLQKLGDKEGLDIFGEFKETDSKF